MNRRTVAFNFSGQKLESSSKGGRTYLWTFTVAEHGLGIREVARRWKNLQDVLRRELPGWAGIRVFEMHPGGHGWHVHVVTNGFWHVRQIRRASQATGWGRIHVARLSAGAWRYVGKYLSKQRWQDIEGSKGVRRWAAFGFLHVRVKDVRCQSFVGRLWQELQQHAHESALVGLDPGYEPRDAGGYVPYWVKLARHLGAMFNNANFGGKLSMIRELEKRALIVGKQCLETICRDLFCKARLPSPALEGFPGTNFPF